MKHRVEPNGKVFFVKCGRFAININLFGLFDHKPLLYCGTVRAFANFPALVLGLFEGTPPWVCAGLVQYEPEVVDTSITFSSHGVNGCIVANGGIPLHLPRGCAGFDAVCERVGKIAPYVLADFFVIWLLFQI